MEGHSLYSWTVKSVKGKSVIQEVLCGYFEKNGNFTSLSFCWGKMLQRRWDRSIFDVETFLCFSSLSLFFVFQFPASVGLWKPCNSSFLEFLVYGTGFYY